MSVKLVWLRLQNTYHPVFMRREGGTVCVQQRNNSIVFLHEAQHGTTGPMAAAYVSVDLFCFGKVCTTKDNGGVVAASTLQH